MAEQEPVVLQGIGCDTRPVEEFFLYGVRFFQPGQFQQLLDQEGHAFALAVDRAEAFLRFVHAFHVSAGILAFRHDGRHGRTQLVGHIGGEALFPFQGCLEAVEHGVEGLGHLVEFVLARCQFDATGQVLFFPDTARGRADDFHGPEAAFDDPVSADGGKKDEERHQDQETADQEDGLFGGVAFHGDAADPVGRTVGMGGTGGAR